MNLKKRTNFYISGFVIFFLLVFEQGQSFAQLNSGNLTRYSENDGLPGAQVNTVIVDRLGYIWAGTVNGLARYDGYEFKRFYYNPNDTATIQGLWVGSIFEDHRGKIWVGTSPSYLNAFDPVSKKFHHYNFTHLVNHPANVEPDVQAIAEDNQGRMYFGINTFFGEPVSSALLYLDEKENELKQFAAPDSLNIQNVLRIIKDKSGNIWVLCYSGIFTIDTNGKLSRFRNLDEIIIRNKDIPGDLQFDKDGHLWISTQNSVLIDYNPETGKYKTWPLDPLHTSKEYNYLTKKIIFDKNDNIWMGSNTGVYFFNRKTGQYSLFNNGINKELEQAPVLDLAVDSFGTLWIASLAAGLLKYEDRPQLKSYSYNKDDKNSLTSGWANLIYETSDGKIWITTNGSAISSGVNILDLRTGNIQPLPYPKFTNRTTGIMAIWENAPGELYMAAFQAVYLFSERTRQLKPVKLPGLPDTTTITCHLKDSHGIEWFSSTSGLFRRTNELQPLKRYDLSLGKGSNASSNQISQVYESKKHGLWLLTNNGLFLYNYEKDSIERHGYDPNEGDIFGTQDINSFYEDPAGIAWVGSWQGGLSRYNVETRKIKTYTRDQGLPSMSVQSILADEKNNALWLSTFEGLSRFTLKNEQFNNYSIADGIQGQLFADASFLKTSNGLFIFGGSNGITIFNPDDLTKGTLPPKVFLTDLKLFNKSIIPGEKSILKKHIDETEQVILAHDQNNISLDFIALHYSNPPKNKYSYKLENYDNEWRDIGNLHTAFYPNLPPGEYLFHVKAANDKGVWNEQGAMLKIIVNRPWWKTTLAYIIYGLLFIALAFAIDRYFRYRLLEKERDRNRARELEQAKEIEKAYYKLAETHETLKATQTQLIQSEKMASLGELTAGIAHEIQNPLNFVNNFSEVNKDLLAEMKNEIDKGNLNEVKSIADDVIGNEEKIYHHGKRADAIVKGMLQHSQISSGRKEPVDINALADEWLRLAHQGSLAKDKSFNTIIKTDFDKAVGKLNIVPQDIGRVLLNLYNNAFYALSAKALATVGLSATASSLRQAQGDASSGSASSGSASSGSASSSYTPTIIVSTKRINDKVEIKVFDNGPGISADIADKIFQPFFTTKPAGQGTGLGLSLSYDIIKAYGGEITVESKPNEGACFIVSLPDVKAG